MGERRGQPGSSSSAAHDADAKPPTRPRSARARCGACATTASTGSPAATRSREQAGDAAAARVAARARRRRARRAARDERAGARRGRGPARASTPVARSAGSPSDVDRRRRARGAGVAQHEPRLDRAVPAVDLEADGGVDGLVAGRRAACRRRRTRRSASARRRRASVKRDVAALPHRPRVGQLRGRDEQRDGAGCPCRTARAARAPRRAASVSASPGHDGVDPRTRARGPRASAPRRRARRSAARKRVDLGARRSCRPAAARWPPWRSRWRAPRVEAAEQVERRDRAARAGALVAVERDQHRRAVVALGDPRGDDADHARVPALAGEHVRGAAGPVLGRPAPRPRTGSASRRRGARR